MLNHLNLVTHRIDATQAFYETHFGFTLLFEEMGERFLGNDDGFLLAISSVESPADSPDWLHFGFCVDSAEEVERRYKQMTADGVEIADEFFAIPGKFVAFYVRDPGGHKVECPGTTPADLTRPVTPIAMSPIRRSGIPERIRAFLLGSAKPEAGPLGRLHC